MMLESIGHRGASAGASRQLDGERRGRGQSQMQAQMNGQSQRGGRGSKMMVDEDRGSVVGEEGEERRGSPGRMKREGRDETR